MRKIKYVHLLCPFDFISNLTNLWIYVSNLWLLTALLQLLKDTIYTKMALMPWIDDNLGHTLSGLTQIGNIIAKLFLKFTIFQDHYRFPL